MSATWEHGTVPCLHCRREVRAYRSRCPWCGGPVVALPGVITEGYTEGQIVRPRKLEPPVLARGLAPTHGAARGI